MATKPVSQEEDFSTPVYFESETHTETAGAGAGDHSASSSASSDDFDLNDPSLLQYEVTGVNLGADPYAAPPPPPDAWYRVKLKRLDVKRKDGSLAAFSIKPEAIKGDPVLLPNGKQKHNAWMALEATILDPGGKYDGLHARDYLISTKIDRRAGTSPIHHLIHNVFKKTLPPTYTSLDLVTLLDKILAGEPECDAELIWRGSPSQTDTEAIRAKGIYAPELKGMHKFPEVDGVRQVETMVEVANYGKVAVRAQLAINGYAPAGQKSKKK